MDFESLQLLGAPLSMYETYFEFEGPRTFALRSIDWSIYYLVNAVEESEDGDALTYLLVMVPEERFRAIRSGQVSFREAYAQAAPGALHSIEWRYEGRDWLATISSLGTPDLPSRWLPHESARLNLKTNTVAKFERSALRQLSNAQNRTVFALEVEAYGHNVTEFPTRKSGELLQAVQGQLDALASEYQGGAYTASRDVQTTVQDLKAASFVLVLAIDKKDTLMERTELTSTVLDRLSALITSASSETLETFFGELSTHSTRVRNRFRDLLAPLVDSGSGLSLNTAVVAGTGVVTTEITPQAVFFAHDAIVNVVPTIKHIELSRATVIGLNVRLGSFELFDNAASQNFQGHMSPEASNQADGMTVGEHSFVAARIRVEWDFEEDATSGVKYILEKIEVLV